MSHHDFHHLPLFQPDPHSTLVSIPHFITKIPIDT
jgi:hypothetical protein